MKRKKEEGKEKVQEKEKLRDEVLRLYVNGKSLDGLELTDKQQLLVSDIAKYWLVKHGCRNIKLQTTDHYGLFAILGIILGILVALVILYYLPV